MLWLAGNVSGIALHGGVSEHVHRVRDKACLKKNVGDQRGRHFPSSLAVSAQRVKRSLQLRNRHCFGQG